MFMCVRLLVCVRSCAHTSPCPHTGWTQDADSSPPPPTTPDLTSPSGAPKVQQHSSPWPRAGLRPAANLGAAGLGLRLRTQPEPAARQEASRFSSSPSSPVTPVPTTTSASAAAATSRRRGSSRAGGGPWGELAGPQGGPAR